MDTLGFSDIELRKLSVYDLGQIGERFDLVIFMGVLYHLRHPLLALDLIREHVAGDLMLFQTMQRGSETVADVPPDHPFFKPGTFDPPDCFDAAGYPKDAISSSVNMRTTGPIGWAPNRACSEAMLRAAGFRIDSRPEAEVYICRVAAVPFR